MTLWASYALGGLSRKKEGGSGEERDRMEEGDLEAASMALFAGLCSVSHLQFHGVSDEHNGSLITRARHKPI